MRRGAVQVRDFYDVVVTTLARAFAILDRGFSSRWYPGTDTSF